MSAPEKHAKRTTHIALSSVPSGTTPTGSHEPAGGDGREGNLFMSGRTGDDVDALEGTLRARNIKPGFFRNEDLGELAPVTRLFFIALWCYADREGRFVDRPKRIRAELLPYDAVDGEEMMRELEGRGFIERYEVSGERYAQILNFKKHQSPHHKEQDSAIPYKDGICPRQTPGKHETSPVDAALDSLDCIDSLDTLDTLVKETQETAAPPQPSSLYRDFEKRVLELWNALPVSFSKVQKLNDSRRTHLKTRYSETEFRDGIETIIEKVRGSMFLAGENGNGWKCTFDWLIKNDSNYTKILEGNYDRGKGGKNGTTGGGNAINRSNGISEQTRKRLASIADPVQRVRTAEREGIIPEYLSVEDVQSIGAAALDT